MYEKGILFKMGGPNFISIPARSRRKDNKGFYDNLKDVLELGEES
jgi:hypothetical protein